MPARMTGRWLKRGIVVLVASIGAACGDAPPPTAPTPQVPAPPFTPPGPATLDVKVYDAGRAFPFPVLRAVIDVVGEDGSRFASTKISYGLRFVDVRGRVRIRVTQPFFFSHEQSLEFTRSQEVAVYLAAAPPPVDLSGLYRLTIEASPSCAVNLDGAHVRSYSAPLTQGRDGGVGAVLAGASFATLWNGPRNLLWGWIEDPGGDVRFDLRDYGMGTNEPDPTIVETLPDGRTFSVIGTGIGRFSGRTISGLLDGTIEVARPPDRGTCRADDHRLTLTPAPL